MPRIGRKSIREPDESKLEMGEIEILQNEFQTYFWEFTKKSSCREKALFMGKIGREREREIF